MLGAGGLIVAGGETTFSAFDYISTITHRFAPRLIASLLLNYLLHSSALTTAVHNPIFYLITAAGAYSSGRRLLGYEHEVPGYYEIPPSQKAGLGLSYVALIAALLLAMSENNKKRKTPKQLQGGYSPRNEDGVLYDDMSSNFISSLDDDDEGFF